MGGQIYLARVVDCRHSSNIVFLVNKDRVRKEVLGNNILLTLMDPTNQCKIMIKTTMFTVASQEEKQSLNYWLLFIMLARSLVIRFMTIGSPVTHHKKHRKHDYQTNSSYTCFHNFSYPKRSIRIKNIINR